MEDALPVREAVVVRLKVSAGVTDHVPAESIYGERVPDNRTFPFIRMGVPISSPARMSCWNGERTGFAVHAFVKGPANDEASATGGAIKDDLDGAVLVLEDGNTRDLIWTGGQIFADREEPDAWHVIQSFEAV